MLVWVSKDEEEQKYSVYYNGSYQFDLRKPKDTWAVKCTRINNPIVDEELAAMITLRIDFFCLIPIPLQKIKF